MVSHSSPAFSNGIDATITVPEGIRQHCQEHQAEQHQGQDTTLFDSVGHWEGFRWFTVVEDSGHHAIMELADDCDESARAAEFLHDLPKAFPADRIEGLGQVNEGRVEVVMLFHALLLELTSSKDHITGPTTHTEATLALREVALLQVLQQVVQQDTGQDLACYRQEGYSSVVIACLAIALPLIDVHESLGEKRNQPQYQAQSLPCCGPHLPTLWLGNLDCVQMA